MSLVSRTVTGILKDADGNLLTGKVIKFTPAGVFGGGGVSVPPVTVCVTTDGTTAAFSIALLTSDVSDSFVRYVVKFHDGSQKKFDLIAGSSTTLDALINLFDGTSGASNTQLLEDLQTAVSELETDDAENVKLTGNQNVDGIKAFTLSPTTPTPTTALQVANKAYVDTNSGAGAGTLGGMVFDDAKLQHIRLNRLFRSDGHYSHQFWEMWFKQLVGQGGAGYILADTQGGSHIILFGTQPSGSRFTFTGNMCIEATTQTVSAINTATDTFTIANHGFYTGQIVFPQSTGTLPAPLTGARCNVIKIDANSFKLAVDYSRAAATPPVPIDITTAGTGTITFLTDYLTSINPSESFLAGEDRCVAVAWTGTLMVVWVDGVLIYTQLFAPAYLYNGGGNDQTMYLAGSDHNNAKIKLYQVRAFLGYGSVPWDSDYAPELYFSSTLNLGTGNTQRAQFCMSLMTKQSQYIDTGEFEGMSHPGVPEAVQGSTTLGSPSVGPALGGASLGLPVFEAGEMARITSVPTAPATPAGAIVFDSFSRPDRTYVNPTPGDLYGRFFAGVTEVGNKTWARIDGVTDLFGGMGILNGRAFIINAAADYGFDTGVQNMDVRVDRLPTVESNTGLILRYKDGSDSYRVTASDTNVTVFKNEGGVLTTVAYTPLAGWTTLRVTASGTTFNVYVGTATEGVFTLLGTFTGTNVTGATKAGLTRSNGIYLPVYYDNFLVK